MATPNITQYSQTLPFFTCQQFQKNCIASTDSAAVQQQCLKIPCGSMDSTMAATGVAPSSGASSTSGNLYSSASNGAIVIASSASGGASSAAGTVTAAAGSATSAAGGVVASATSAAASAATSARPGNDATAATAGFGMLGAAVAGMVAFLA